MKRKNNKWKVKLIKLNSQFFLSLLLCLLHISLYLILNAKRCDVKEMKMERKVTKMSVPFMNEPFTPKKLSCILFPL